MKKKQYALNVVINLRKKQLDGLVIYKYSAATSTQASSTSTSTSNLYSSTTLVQVQVPSTTSLVDDDDSMITNIMTMMTFLLYEL